MALRKTTQRKNARKRKNADPIMEWAQQVTSFMTDELGVEEVEDIGKVARLMLKAVEAQLGVEDEEEEEDDAPVVRKSSRKRRTTSKRKKQEPADNEEGMSIGRISLWENNGTGNFEFNGNLQFRFDGGRIKSSKDVDLEASVLLFEPDDDSKYLFSGIITEKVEKRRGRKSKRSPIIGRIYVYDSGSREKKKGLEAYAYLYLIDPDDEGDNVDPDYLLDFIPEDLVPEEGAFAKCFIYENDSDSENAPLFTGKVALPGVLETDDEDEEDDEEEEEAPQTRRGSRRNARSKRTPRSRDKGEATTGRRRKGRSSRKSSSKSALDFTAVDMPDVYDDEDEDE